MTSHVCWIRKIMLIMLSRLSTRFSWYVATCPQRRSGFPLTSRPYALVLTTVRKEETGIRTNPGEQAPVRSRALEAGRSAASGRARTCTDGRGFADRQIRRPSVRADHAPRVSRSLERFSLHVFPPEPALDRPCQPWNPLIAYISSVGDAANAVSI